MRGNPRWAALALIAWLPLSAHASTWRMDGIGDVDGAYPSPMLVPFELTAQIDDAALAGGLRIRASCDRTGCSSVSGPTSAIQFGGIADQVNPLIPTAGLTDGISILITLDIAPAGGLVGEIRLGGDWAGARSFDLNIISQADGSWTGLYDHDDAPFWTLSAPRWAMVAPVGDPVGVPEPPYSDLMAMAAFLALTLSRGRLL